MYLFEQQRKKEQAEKLQKEEDDKNRLKEREKEQKRIMEEILSAKSDRSMLRVTSSSTPQEIRQSYRKLSIYVHPDKNSHPDASRAFKGKFLLFEK